MRRTRGGESCLREICYSFLVLLFFLPVFGTPGTSFAADSERITDFQSWILVHRDGSMSVSEEIRVICEGKQIKRGIFRDFPTRYKDRHGKTFQVTFDVREVLRNGRPESYHIENLSNGERVYMGRKDTLLKPGAYTYRISYKTSRQIGFFKDFDELYWNVTGNGWSFPIDHAEAVVSLPPGAKILKETAYTGVQGGKGQDYTVKIGGAGGGLFCRHPHAPARRRVYHRGCLAQGDRLRTHCRGQIRLPLEGQPGGRMGNYRINRPDGFLSDGLVQGGQRS